MNRYSPWQYAIIAIALIVGFVYALPNFYGEAPAVQVSPLKPTIKADESLQSRVEESLRKAGITTSGVFLDHADRKSTRLNSSHSSISYAVFCLKKKKNDLSIRHSHLLAAL